MVQVQVKLGCKGGEGGEGGNPELRNGFSLKVRRGSP